MARRVLALLLLHLLLISVAQTCEQQVTPVQKVIQMLIHDMGAKGKYANIIRERNML